jgi:hypothetical protein
MLLVVSMFAAGDALADRPATRLGELRIGPAGCLDRPCAIKVTPRSRYRGFAIATDAPYGLPLEGSVEVTCHTGTGTKALLLVPTNMGVFQEVDNPCLDADVTAIELVVSSATLREQDKRLGVTVTLLAVT